MPLANEFFLLAHDERGKARLHARAAGIGLAAGVLAELVLTGHLDIRETRVVVRPVAAPSWPFTADQQRTADQHRTAGVNQGRHFPPADSVAHAVFEQITHEAAVHHVRTWLAVLAPTITESVAGRLVRLGLIHVEQAGRLRRTNRYVSTDVNASAAVSVRLARRLTRRDPNLDWEDAVLAGLCRATGLLDEVLYDDNAADGRRYLGQVMRQVASQAPALIELFANTESAVGDAVLTHRT